MKKERKVIITAAAVLAAALWMCFMPARVEIDMGGKVYEHRPFTKERVSVTVTSAAGVRLPFFEKHTKINTTVKDNKAYVTTQTAYLLRTTTEDVVRAKGIEAQYTAKAYPGDYFRKENLHVETIFEDGTRLDDTDYKIAKAPDRFNKRPARIKITSPDGEETLRVKTVGIKDVKANVPEKIYQYDTLEVSEIVVQYDDGWFMELDKEDVDFDIDLDEPLEELGEQKVAFTYQDVEYNFMINTLENTNVSNAARENKEEMKEADYSYLSDNCYVAITKHEDSLGTYYISHVVVNDPSQIHSNLSYDDWGGRRERPSNAVDRLGLVLATNGSYFSYDTNAPRCADVYIKDGKVYSDPYVDEEEEEETTTNGQEMCLLEDGTLWTPPEGLTADELLKDGVTDIWGAGDPLLIQDGKLYPTHHDWVNGKYPRTGIGMVKPCEYYILTAGSGGYRGGLTFDDVQKIFKDLGCDYARTLDGGGSSTLAMESDDGAKVINNPAGGTERPVVDIFGISDITTS